MFLAEVYTPFISHEMNPSLQWESKIYSVKTNVLPKAKKLLRAKFRRPKEIHSDLEFALSSLPEAKRRKKLFYFARLHKISSVSVKEIPIKNFSSDKFAI
jgi:hypothetical protein